MFIYGCSIHHDYVWQQGEIDSDQINLQESSTNRQIEAPNITSSWAGTNEIVLGHTKATAHYWVGTLQTVSDSVAKNLTNELERLGYPSSKQAQKKVQIEAKIYEINQGMQANIYTVIVELKLGNGISKTIKSKISDGTDSPARAADRVISQATLDILNNKEFQVYLNSE